MNKEDIDYSLYLVTDRKNKTTEEFLKIIEESIQGGVTVVQLREKDTPTKEFYQIAIKLKETYNKKNYNKKNYNKKTCNKTKGKYWFWTKAWIQRTFYS